MASFDDIPKPEWTPEVVSHAPALKFRTHASITLAGTSRTRGGLGKVRENRGRQGLLPWPYRARLTQERN
jgi:hypothetical protein